MAEIVNLRRARKAKARSEREAAAAENRILHGLPGAVRSAEAARRERADQVLDGHRLAEAGGSEDGPSSRRTDAIEDAGSRRDTESSS
ncbi:DUF4169 family protein [Fulvimarina endophytica]|uniref:DUF4169 family protein n=1 Tax=Fulvimarina endophytica TaxID=2293836 RepID=A0A371X061_9HYPH|nr:DUF4169 family protein [Fulvimarina endophytica]RFC62618.1 DUF4169 family protein [Fulvimarina endophytica]